jgi:hypothetical protein
VTTICNGVSTSATLTASGGSIGSGAVYEWGTGTVGNNKLSPSTTTAATRSVTLSAATTYWVRRTGTGACSATTTGGVTVSVTVNPVPSAPTMSGAGTHCTGSANITASAGTYGNGIRWDDGSTASARTVTVSGPYRAITTSAAGCTSSTATVVVTIGTGSPSGSAPNTACACASGLTECDGTCLASCDGCATFNSVSTIVTEGAGQRSAAQTLCTNKGSGWRLPTLAELTCVCQNRAKYSIDYVTNIYYWTSTAGAQGSGEVLMFGYFGECTHVARSYDDDYYVKCVK